MLLGLLIVAASAYFAGGAWLMRYRLEPLLFPRISLPRTAAIKVRSITGEHGNSLLVRKYGNPSVGCVVFFPGQHGNIAAYESDLFPAFTAQGLAVLAISYPGQNGAAGRANLSEIPALIQRAVAELGGECPSSRTVFYGRSLGSMLAAYSASRSVPAGLILESAAPSLSAALRVQLASRWYLKPLVLLPISKLLAHDYSLPEALLKAPALPVVLFQGTADTQTPLKLLEDIKLPSNLLLVPVAGGTHSTTFVLARRQLVATALSMLR
jgi:alpha-beta hydrolase superfamily lysophospholipase